VARDIRYSDGESPAQQAGHFSVFGGIPEDLIEGTFDFRVR
jgi:hypothetical protein